MGAPVVGIIMGSESDYETLRHAEDVMQQFGVDYEIEVVSAHRTPQRMVEYASTARERGLLVVIAGAGGAAHLPGMVSAMTSLPVLGVPVRTQSLGGLDSLLSIVQMPAGVPTATFAVGPAGAANAGLFAVRVLALTTPALQAALEAYRESTAAKVVAGNRNVQARLRSEGGGT
jgi:5-(carboxyamino)imidazole ribonucleotide mutase